MKKPKKTTKKTHNETCELVEFNIKRLVTQFAVFVRGSQNNCDASLTVRLVRDHTDVGVHQRDGTSLINTARRRSTAVVELEEGGNT